MVDISIGTVHVDKSRGPRERSEEQQEYDRNAKALYDAWVSAGRPTQDVPAIHHPVTIVGMTPEQREEAVKKVEARYRSAALLHGYSFRSFGYEKGDKPGHVNVLVGMMDRRKYSPRKPKSDAVPTQTAPEQ